MEKLCGLLPVFLCLVMAGGSRELENGAMRMQWTWLGTFGVLAVTATAVVTTPDFDLGWYTLDSGGTTSATGGAFELSGTVGQPDAGVKPMEGGGFELTGGFWFRLAPGDCNEDGGVNLFDCGDFEACMVGPSIGPGGAPCPCFDLDADNDVDLADFAEFQRGFGG